MKLDHFFQTDLLEAKDERISKMSEFLSGIIFAIILYCWDKIVATIEAIML